MRTLAKALEWGRSHPPKTEQIYVTYQGKASDKGAFHVEAQMPGTRDQF